MTTAVAGVSANRMSKKIQELTIQVLEIKQSKGIK